MYVLHILYYEIIWAVLFWEKIFWYGIDRLRVKREALRVLSPFAGAKSKKNNHVIFFCPFIGISARTAAPRIKNIKQYEKYAILKIYILNKHHKNNNRVYIHSSPLFYIHIIKYNIRNKIQYQLFKI